MIVDRLMFKTFQSKVSVLFSNDDEEEEEESGDNS